jgi:hypothetical protein
MGKEVNSGDFRLNQPPPIILAEGPLAREAEDIAVVDTPLMSDYAKELAFNEDILTIRLERSSEKFAPKIIQVAVQGVNAWIQVGIPQRLARKYVEVLARSKPMDVQTDVLQRDGEDPVNSINRTVRSRYPFSVLNDPSPMGFEWLSRIMVEQA